MSFLFLAQLQWCSVHNCALHQLQKGCLGTIWILGSLLSPSLTRKGGGGFITIESWWFYGLPEHPGLGTSLHQALHHQFKPWSNCSYAWREKSACIKHSEPTITQGHTASSASSSHLAAPHRVPAQSHSFIPVLMDERHKPEAFTYVSLSLKNPVISVSVLSEWIKFKKQYWHVCKQIYCIIMLRQLTSFISCVPPRRRISLYELSEVKMAFTQIEVRGK